MKICKKCGAQLDDDALFCNVCGARQDEPEVQNAPAGNTQHSYYQPSQPQRTAQPQSGIADMAANAASAIGEKVNTVRDNYQRAAAAAQKNSVVLAEGEIPVREYEVTKIRKWFFSKISGHLLVTNKRVIFYAGAINDKVVLSTPVNQVGSINGVMGYYLKQPLFTFGLAALGFSIFMLFTAGAMKDSYYMAREAGKLSGWGIMLLLLALVLIFLSIRKSLYLSISAVNSSTGMIIGKGNTIASSVYLIDGEADVDSEAAFNEIGALVLDLQQMGDLAIEKWHNR